MITVAALRPCELFAGLSDQELAEIAAIAREEAYQCGQEIFREQGLAVRLFILQSGRVQLQIHLRSSLQPDGEVTIEDVEPGRIFGWSSLVNQRRFTASARALEPVSVIALDAAELNALFNRNAHIGFVVMKQLAEVIASRLHLTRARLEEEEVRGC